MARPVFGLDVSLEGFEAIERKLKSPALIQRPKLMMLQKGALIAERVAKTEAPRDTGDLARRISSDVTDVGARVFVMSARVSDFAVEEGRAAGQPPPPPGALRGWMARHGVPLEMEFALARAISRRGIKGRFFMRKGAEAAQREMPRLLRELSASIKKEWLR